MLPDRPPPMPATTRNADSAIDTRLLGQLPGGQQHLERLAVEHRNAEGLGLGELAGPRAVADDDGEGLGAHAAGALAAAILDRRLGLLAGVPLQRARDDDRLAG